METLDLRIDEIAQEIARWEVARQETLLQKLVDLNYRRGLKVLSEKIKKRLLAEGKFHQSVNVYLPRQNLLPSFKFFETSLTFAEVVNRIFRQTSKET